MTDGFEDYEHEKTGDFGPSLAAMKVILAQVDLICEELGIKKDGHINIDSGCAGDFSWHDTRVTVTLLEKDILFDRFGKVLGISPSKYQQEIDKIQRSYIGPGIISISVAEKIFKLRNSSEWTQEKEDMLSNIMR